jgi:hypothetical protein
MGWKFNIDSDRHTNKPDVIPYVNNAANDVEVQYCFGAGY